MHAYLLQGSISLWRRNARAKTPQLGFLISLVRLAGIEWMDGLLPGTVIANHNARSSINRVHAEYIPQHTASSRDTP